MREHAITFERKFIRASGAVKSLATDMSKKKITYSGDSLKPPLDKFSVVESIQCSKFRVS